MLHLQVTLLTLHVSKLPDSGKNMFTLDILRIKIGGSTRSLFCFNLVPISKEVSVRILSILYLLPIRW